ncbi:LytR/AlgR family response regulator transcription factor [Agarilytica rhodophyticola]|uniref:LytR/AlgR family response regulator transcription factor n=1 Tax=Agarilytica rhodophyticola TaxID=1737490 RepID=UPI000B340FAE|nr:LytTR family DNA-binding domain-containing protein [Agarilytica rhodophyticola]
MHILIVDDEVLARQRLIKLLAKLGYDVVSEAENGEQALSAVESLDPDIVFMDVKMPGVDGVEAARSIAELDEPPAIIFCTAYDEYALQAIDAQAVGYIVKPVHEEQLSEILQKAQRVNKLQRAVLSGSIDTTIKRKHISAKTRKGIELIAIEDIYCFIADQKYVTVMHCNGETLIDDTLKELENELASGFLRVHRNALISIDCIVGLERTNAGHFEVVLKNTDFRPMVSRRHLSTVKSVVSSL